MNNARRKELKKAVALLEQAKEIIYRCHEEEHECYDNLTEGGQKFESNDYDFSNYTSYDHIKD